MADRSRISPELRPRILCVDDEPHVCEGLRDILEPRFDVAVAGSGAEGLTVLERHRGGFAIVLSDMRMPGMSGADFLREARRIAPDTVRVLLTGHTDLTAAIRAVNDGQLFRFLSKPCPPEELLRTCAEALGQHLRHRSERVLLEIHAAESNDDIEVQEEGGHNLDGAPEANPGLLDRSSDGVRQRIETVICEEELSVVYQPIVDLRRGTTVGFEALARFSPRPERPPNLWFDEAERVGRRVELELLALRIALRGLPRLPGNTFLSVNASPVTILSPALPGVLGEATVERLILEVTEQRPIPDYRRFTQAIDPLRTRGLRLAVDDFGSGFTSLSHVLRLEPDLIKLDRTLIQHVDTHRPARALAVALETFAIETGTRVLAEGIETSRQLTLLTSLGISLGQGYLLGRPRALPDAVREATGRAMTFGNRVSEPAALSTDLPRTFSARRAS